MRSPIQSSVIYLAIGAFGLACASPEPAPEVRAHFSVEVQGEAPSAQLQLTNNSTGADTYLWNFEGSTLERSTEFNPSPVLVEQAGQVRVILTAANGLQGSRRDTTITINGFSPIQFYQNIKFRLNDDPALPRYYSVETNRSLNDDEVSAELGPLVDVVLVAPNTENLYFASPDNAGLNFSINQPSTTIIDHNPDNNGFTLADFEATVNASSLDTLTINTELGAFSTTTVPTLVFFQTNNGFKGIVKVISINETEGYLLADVKVQKYL